MDDEKKYIAIRKTTKIKKTTTTKTNKQTDKKERVKKV